MNATVAVVNQKGGVAKTTTAINLAAALGKLDKRVLLIDLDPQGNATRGCGIRLQPDMPTVFDVIMGRATVAETVIETNFKNMFVVPSDVTLAESEIFFQKIKSDTPRTLFLRQALASSRFDYDVIIIDCLPSLGTLALNGVTAADYVIIPMQCEPYSMDGIKEILTTVKRVRNSHNKRLDILGIVFTMYSKNVSINQTVKMKIKQSFPPDKLFKTEIPRNVRISEAPGYGEPVIYYDPKSSGAKSYLALGDEVAEKLFKSENLAKAI